jgi:hypothetical protein
MEAHSSSLPTLPFAVGGLVGHIMPPGDGRFVGGCMGFVRLDSAEHRYVGGLAGHAFHPGLRRFVGGCVSFAGLSPHHAHPGSRLHDRARRRAHARWGEEALEGAPA